jgi:hypothetical protein
LRVAVEAHRPPDEPADKRAGEAEERGHGLSLFFRIGGNRASIG